VVQTPVQDHSEVHVRSAVEDVNKLDPLPSLCVYISSAFACALARAALIPGGSKHIRHHKQHEHHEHHLKFDRCR
jgi:hypothetical protein